MWRRVSDFYRACMSKIIDRHDGMIARDVSHDMLAYFGYPHAQEDDAEQAVRARRARTRRCGSKYPGQVSTPHCRFALALRRALSL